MTPTPSLTCSSIVVRSDAPLSAQVAGRTVLMSTEQGKYYDFDSVSTRVWQYLSSPIEVRALCATLAAEYDGEPATIQSDILALLSTLLEHRLIDVH